MQLTKNLGLKKPEDADFYNIQDFNDNMDALDEKVQECLESAEQSEALKTHTSDKNNPHKVTASQIGAVAVGSSTMAYGLTPDSLSTTIGNLGFTLDNTFEELYQILKNNYNKFENYFLLVTTSNSSVFNNSLPIKTGCTIECINIKSASTRCTFKLHNFRNNDIYINTVLDGVLNGWVKLADINDAVASANSLNVIEIVANTNLNNLNVSGFYYSPTNANTQTLLNVPPIQTSFFMMVGKHAGIYQEITEYIPNNPKKFIRNSYNGVWGEWIEISKIIDHNLKTYTSLEQLGTNVDDITKWTGLVPLNSQLTFTVDLSKLSILYPKGLLPANSAGSIRVINTTGRGFIEYVCGHGYYYAFSDNLDSQLYEWTKISTETDFNNYNLKTYTDLSQIGITVGSETISSIAEKLPEKSMLEIDITSSNANIYPEPYGKLKVEKINATCVAFEFWSKRTTGVTEFFRTWVGAWSTGNWSNWSKLATSTDIDELKTNFQAGCSKIATSITNNGVTTANNASPDTMASNISTLATNKYNAGVTATKKGTATASDVLSGKTFTNSSSVAANGSMPNKSGVTVDASNVSSDTEYTYLTVPERGCYDTSSKLRIPNTDIPTSATLVKLTSSTLRSNASRTITVTKSSHGVDPSTLTKNNFLVVYVSSTMESTSSDGNTDAQMSVSYTASTGKLTISKFGNYGYRANNNDSYPLQKMWVNYNVYLIKNK